MHSIEIKDILPCDEARTIELLHQGFEYEPTYRWCLCADEEPGFSERLLLCMQADFRYHHQYGFMQGAYVNDQLMGIVFVQPPDMSEIGAGFSWDEILTACGEGTKKRIELYMAEVFGVKLAPRYHKVSFVVVDENCRGQGIGSLLLAQAQEIMQSDATSLGLQLETSNLNNVKLYERIGYQVKLEKNFYGIQQYLMFKERTSK